MRRNPLKYKRNVKNYFIVNIKIDAWEYEPAAVLESYLLSGIAEAEGSSQLQQKRSESQHAYSIPPDIYYLIMVLWEGGRRERGHATAYPCHPPALKHVWSMLGFIPTEITIRKTNQ
jgi:hypothetical protein